MSRPTPQAQRLIEAAAVLAVPRDQWAVRTQTRRFREGGRTYREYGDAVLIWYTRTAREAILAHAQDLADAGFRVTISHGDPIDLPTVSSDPNPNHIVFHHRSV